MAKEVVEQVESGMVGYDPEAFDWDLQHEESPDQIVFENLGDEFTGLLLGSEVIDFTRTVKGEEVADSFTQWRFRGPEVRHGRL